MDDLPVTLTADYLAEAFGHLVAPGAAGLVLAVSGGSDSMALMRVAADLRPGGRLPTLHVATVDHGFRSSAAADAQVVESEARALGLPCQILRWIGEKPATRLQERARGARYGLLIAHCHAVGADHLATAHTLDDQAETVVFRLLRGSGAAGLAGMRPATHVGGVTLIRPLLGVPKASLVATCDAFGLPVCHDPANTDPQFARTRLRALLPTLAREGATMRTFGRLATRMARVDAALADVAASAFRDTALTAPPGMLRLDMRRLAEAPAEIAIRVLAMALTSMGAGSVRLERLERLTNLLGSHADARLSRHATLGGMMLRLRLDGVLTIIPQAPRRLPATNHAAAPARPFPWQA